MMSNKWAFSLTSLITIFALAFVVTPAMAAFDVTITAEDVMEGGGIEIEYSSEAQVIDISFGEVIKPVPAGVGSLFDVVTIDGNGLPSSPVTVNSGNGTPANGKNFTLTLATAIDYNADEAEAGTLATKIFVQIAEKKVSKYDDAKNMNNAKSATINLVRPDPNPSAPDVRAINLANNLLVPDAGFTGDTFDIIVTLSEEPKEGKLTGGHFDVTNGTASDGVFLGKGDFIRSSDNNEFHTTGRDRMQYQYLVTITPEAKDGDLVIKLKSFEDQKKPTSYKYMPPLDELAYQEMWNKLTVKINKAAAAAALGEGHEVLLTPKRVIPAGGFLIVATATGDTGINLPTNADADDNTPKDSERSPAERKYNAISVDIPNLEAFLNNGGTIDLVSPNAGLVISEIMWGSDASLETNSQSQWIEIKNTTAADIKTGDKTHKLIFYGPNETVPPKTAAVAATATTKAVPAALPAGVVDRVGTIDDKGGYWSLAGKGQSGRTGFGEDNNPELAAVVPTLPLISMYRVMVPDTSAGAAVGAMMPAYGNTAAAWMQSTPPAVNQDPAKGGNRIASPGDDRIITAAEKAAMEAAAKAKADAAAAAAAAAADTSVMVPAVGAIYVSEVMFAGGGTLPQWIEISNGSRTEEVNLSGWTLTVNNAVADADVSVGASIMFTIPEGTTIMPSAQNESPSTLLVVTEIGRNNVPAASGQVLNLWQAGQTELILAGVTKRRYSLLSDMAFEIVLAPPAPKATVVAATATAAQKAAAKASDLKAMAAHAAATDMAGNLGADGAAAWALPMSDEGGRSSIIRRHIPVSIGPAEPEDGAMMESWALASDTSFAQATHVRASSYYGAMNDVGTPGFRAGGALPVELSHFRPVRNAETGQVVITWSTQSELNNAGFFIKRSQQRDGQFQVINATMVAGAGTTSEKQFYTYTDSTAQPNVVYYYQIEDVSLDGNRQTLTHGTRLRGHIGAAGKLTATWGELKTSNE